MGKLGTDLFSRSATSGWNPLNTKARDLLEVAIPRHEGPFWIDREQTRRLDGIGRAQSVMGTQFRRLVQDGRLQRDDRQTWILEKRVQPFQRSNIRLP